MHINFHIVKLVAGPAKMLDAVTNTSRKPVEPPTEQSPPTPPPRPASPPPPYRRSAPFMPAARRSRSFNSRFPKRFVWNDGDVRSAETDSTHEDIPNPEHSVIDIENTISELEHHSALRSESRSHGTMGDQLLLVVLVVMGMSALALVGVGLEALVKAYGSGTEHSSHV